MSNEEKQIEEMAKDICIVKGGCDDVCNPIEDCRIRCENCKYWKKLGNDPIIQRCFGECRRPLGEYGGLKETAENDFCSYAEKREYETQSEKS